MDKVTSITFKGLLNFTNSQQLAGADSGNCLINSLINNEGQPMQEVLGEVTELFVDNIDQHPYHHHVQPYQIVALGNDSDEMNAWWRVRSFACFALAQLWAALCKGDVVQAYASASAAAQAPCRAGVMHVQPQPQLVQTAIFPAQEQSILLSIIMIAHP